MPDTSPGTALHSAVEVIAKAVSDVFSQSLASRWKVEVKPDQTSEPSDAPCVYFVFSCSGNLQGSAVLQLRHTDVLTLTEKLLAETSASTELTKEHRDALAELLRQVAGLAEIALQSKFGELKVKVSPVEAPPNTEVTFLLLASEASSASCTLRLHLSNDLAASLSRPANAEVPASAEGEENQTSEKNLDLLLGVDLNLTLRFGQRVLTLREILDLTSGSVIELDRQVQEPADLLLGDKLIARGEVVIVDGNYGIRITEVVDPRQRMNAV
ncbi:MAG TPA: FliM/FliN family flagellar motor switch protein [Terriglobales bacterium]|nr:FliM/FliN family flagellar motor switch protein [Terriglobales bacterium]HXY13095.1 FliM/FliN family flagellar motor switch protein [Terriglobales bacterium]